MKDLFCKSLKKRNSLLELYRFLGSIWILYIHDYFFVSKQTGLFSRGQIAVDFFFMLSGLFLIKGIKRHMENKKFFTGLLSFDFKRLKNIGSGFAFPISMICTTIVYFAVMLPTYWPPFYLFRFNWYIGYLILGISIYYALYYILNQKNKTRIFYYLLIPIIAASYFVYWRFSDFGFVRAMGGLGIGMLLSICPALKCKIRNFNMNIVFAAIILGVGIWLCSLSQKPLYLEILIVLGVFPTLIYFTNNINFSFKPFDFLGRLSVGIYLYQSINYLLEEFKILKNSIIFTIIPFVCAILDIFIPWLIKTLKEKRLRRKEECLNQGGET